jgi:hypothetical protein
MPTEITRVKVTNATPSRINIGIDCSITQHSQANINQDSTIGSLRKTTLNHLLPNGIDYPIIIGFRYLHFPWIYLLVLLVIRHKRKGFIRCHIGIIQHFACQQMIRAGASGKSYQQDSRKEHHHRSFHVVEI